MATLDQIAAALKAADAAGNTEDAKRLAAAYRSMQGQPQAAAASPDVAAIQKAHATMPRRAEGSPEQIAAAQSAIDAPVPDGHDAGSQVLAGVTAGLDAIPLAGPSIMGGLRGIKAAAYGTSPDKLAAEEKAARDANPVASTIGTVAGNVLPFALVPAASLGGKALGMSGPLLQRVAAGAISGATINAADTAVRGGSLQDAGTSAIEGGAIAGGLPLVGSIVKGVGRAFKAPLPAAATGEAMRAEAGVGYDAARATGAQFEPKVFSPLGTDLRAIASDSGAVMPDGKLASGYPRVKVALKATEQFGKGEGPVTIQQQATLRKIIANAADSGDKTEARIGAKMLDQFDQYFDNLPDSAFVGKSAAGPAAMASIAKARQAYSQAMRVKTFENVISRAKRAGGSDAAYRSEFKSFLNSARKTRGFPPGQLAAIDAFVQGGKMSNLLSALSKTGSVSGAVAGGFTGGPVGAVAGLVGAPVLRAAAGRAAAGQAEALRGMVAGAPPPTAAGQWLERLLNMNENPANLGVVPQALAGLTTGP